jgi:hypothetical protein
METGEMAEVIAEAIKILDPDNIPVRVVNKVEAIATIGSQIDLMLTTSRTNIGTDNAIVFDHIVAARLRFGLEMARIIRDALDSQIAILTSSEGQNK